MSSVATHPRANGGQNLVIADLIPACGQGLEAAQRLGDAAARGVRAMVSKGGQIDAALLDRNQFAAHGYAWLATYVSALEQMLAWARRLKDQGSLRELEQLMLQAAFGEYLGQMTGGLAMSQVEIIRPADMGIDAAAIAAFQTDAVTLLVARGNTAAVRARIAELIAGSLESGDMGHLGLEDDALDMMRQQFRRFVGEKVMPAAHGWHLRDELIPLDIVQQMADLGVFGLTIPDRFGGLGMGKMSMCVVTEELSRGYIGVGSLGTRSEIAGELIRLFGTPAQKDKYLPAIASGALLPTAVFTEPNTGSDLASLKTRAERGTNAAGHPVYRVFGNKTWITHAARADVMTLLVRTNPNEPGYKGLSMLIAEKPRGADGNPFPAPGMNGGEIRVLGYRGMKEYEIAFDGFEVKADAVLGGIEGQGFKQLMATFESARIQTAARAVGVAQCALELGLAYARERIQFGGPIFQFPRVAGKLAWMAVETMVARQIAFFAAREKDSERRCDIEAGMAKLLAARVAWSNADNALQIHGGNGYAFEYPISRVLCDARILNIFEGAAEIQAQVIARGLLSGRN
ncbi:MAG: acyl-CoA dehydrogenase family protein [Alphaproteobacteria bacterium]